MIHSLSIVPLENAVAAQHAIDRSLRSCSVTSRVTGYNAIQQMLIRVGDVVGSPHEFLPVRVVFQEQREQRW